MLAHFYRPASGQVIRAYAIIAAMDFLCKTNWSEPEAGWPASWEPLDERSKSWEGQEPAFDLARSLAGGFLLQTTGVWLPHEDQLRQTTIQQAHASGFTSSQTLHGLLCENGLLTMVVPDSAGDILVEGVRRLRARSTGNDLRSARPKALRLP